MRYLISVMALALGTAEAAASAWPRPPDETFVSITFGAFSTAADAPEGEAFERLSLDYYMEYGLTERITVGGKAVAGLRTDADEAGEVATDVAAFAQTLLWRGSAGDVISIRGRVTASLDDLASTPASDIDDGEELRAALQYGRGLDTPWGNGWLDSALGYATYTGARADQVTADLTLGLRPAERWLGLVQMFGTVGLGNEELGGADFDAIKLKTAVGREFDAGPSVLLGLGGDVYTRGIDAGLEATLTLWTSF